MNGISFLSHNDKIAGNLFPASQGNCAFLFIQGWTGRQNTIAAQALADLGFTSLTYDMRGNGESGGNLEKLSRADFVDDAVIAYDFLKKHIGRQAKIGVVGASFGGYTAVMLSERRNIACLSLRVPACYPDEGFERPQLAQLGEWRKEKYDYSKSRPMQLLHKFTGKVQIVEAGNDEIVPHRIIENYVSAVSEKRQLEYKIMKDAPHRLADEKLSNEYVQLLTAWAKQFLDSN